MSSYLLEERAAAAEAGSNHIDSNLFPVPNLGRTRESLHCCMIARIRGGKSDNTRRMQALTP